MTKLTN